VKREHLIKYISTMFKNHPPPLAISFLTFLVQGRWKNID